MPNLRPVSWVAAAAIVAGALLVLLGRTPPEPAAVPLAGVAGAEAPLAPTPAETLPAPRPHEHDHVHDLAAELSEAGEDPPPPPGVDGADTNPPIEPEQPQTPAWRLAKTTRLVTMVQERIGRLEARVAEANGRGDADEAREAGILLERTRKRLAALEHDVEALEREVSGGAGASEPDAGELSPAEPAP